MHICSDTTNDSSGIFSTKPTASSSGDTLANSYLINWVGQLIEYGTINSRMLEISDSQSTSFIKLYNTDFHGLYSMTIFFVTNDSTELPGRDFG